MIYHTLAAFSTAITSGHINIHTTFAQKNQLRCLCFLIGFYQQISRFIMRISPTSMLFYHIPRFIAIWENCYSIL